MKIFATIIFSVFLSNLVYSQSTHNYADYIPYKPEYNPTKYVRIAIHVLQRDDSIANFENNPSDIWWIKHQIFENINGTMRNLKPMRLQYNGAYIKDSRVQYVIDTILFHVDNEAWDMSCETHGTKSCKITHKKGMNLYEKYALADSGLSNRMEEVHIFIGENQKCKGRASGIGDKKWILVTGIYRLYAYKNFWEPSGLLMHELWHSLGLLHTWNQDDNCEDTPRNAGCYGDTCSNNMMDYNASQSALTECQLGIIHYHLNGNKGNIHEAVIKTYCNKNDSPIVIKQGENVVWNNRKYLEVDIYIEKNATLTIKGMLSIPKNGSIYIHPKGVLIVDGGTIKNICNETWYGLVIDKTSISIKKAIKKKNLILKNQGQITD